MPVERNRVHQLRMRCEAGDCRGHTGSAGACSAVRLCTAAVANAAERNSAATAPMQRNARHTAWTTRHGTCLYHRHVPRRLGGGAWVVLPHARVWLQHAVRPTIAAAVGEACLAAGYPCCLQSAREYGIRCRVLASMAYAAECSRVWRTLVHRIVRVSPSVPWHTRSTPSGGCGCSVSLHSPLWRHRTACHRASERLECAVHAGALGRPPLLAVACCSIVVVHSLAAASRGRGRSFRSTRTIPSIGTKFHPTRPRPPSIHRKFRRYGCSHHRSPELQEISDRERCPPRLKCLDSCALSGP